eukprot:gnl/Dysnectes_brevis/4900_a6805_333.p1 GENE.gnl/Dysnectes_brevis/4900_a6805_333~~gnl/Dysnectes_brevis/4900_a6805_333.p1  ORF type:complete len:1877 (+),score=425.25 gnl/Dysnectes_brevis/4900_a6805_333:2-5632(+)
MDKFLTDKKRLLATVEKYKTNPQKAVKISNQFYDNLLSLDDSQYRWSRNQDQCEKHEIGYFPVLLDCLDLLNKLSKIVLQTDDDLNDEIVVFHFAFIRLKFLQSILPTHFRTLSDMLTIQSYHLDSSNLRFMPTLTAQIVANPMFPDVWKEETTQLTLDLRSYFDHYPDHSFINSFDSTFIRNLTSSGTTITDQDINTRFGQLFSTPSDGLVDAMNILGPFLIHHAQDYVAQAKPPVMACHPAAIRKLLANATPGNPHLLRWLLSSSNTEAAEAAWSHIHSVLRLDRSPNAHVVDSLVAGFYPANEIAEGLKVYIKSSHRGKARCPKVIRHWVTSVTSDGGFKYNLSHAKDAASLLAVIEGAVSGPDIESSIIANMEAIISQSTCFPFTTLEIRRLFTDLSCSQQRLRALFKLKTPDFSLFMLPLLEDHSYFLPLLQAVVGATPSLMRAVIPAVAHACIRKPGTLGPYARWVSEWLRGHHKQARKAGAVAFLSVAAQNPHCRDAFIDVFTEPKAHEFIASLVSKVSPDGEATSSEDPRVLISNITQGFPSPKVIVAADKPIYAYYSKGVTGYPQVDHDTTEVYFAAIRDRTMPALPSQLISTAGDVIEYQEVIERGYPTIPHPASFERRTPRSHIDAVKLAAHYIYTSKGRSVEGFNFLTDVPYIARQIDSNPLLAIHFFREFRRIDIAAECSAASRMNFRYFILDEVMSRVYRFVLASNELCELYGYFMRAMMPAVMRTGCYIARDPAFVYSDDAQQFVTDVFASLITVLGNVEEPDEQDDNDLACSIKYRASCVDCMSDVLEALAVMRYPRERRLSPRDVMVDWFFKPRFTGPTPDFIFLKPLLETMELFRDTSQFGQPATEALPTLSRSLRRFLDHIVSAKMVSLFVSARYDARILVRNMMTNDNDIAMDELAKGLFTTAFCRLIRSYTRSGGRWKTMYDFTPHTFAAYLRGFTITATNAAVVADNAQALLRQVELCKDSDFTNAVMSILYSLPRGQFSSIWPILARHPLTLSNTPKPKLSTLFRPLPAQRIDLAAKFINSVETLHVKSGISNDAVLSLVTGPLRDLAALSEEHFDLFAPPAVRMAAQLSGTHRLREPLFQGGLVAVAGVLGARILDSAGKMGGSPDTRAEVSSVSRTISLLVVNVCGGKAPKATRSAVAGMGMADLLMDLSAAAGLTSTLPGEALLQRYIKPLKDRDIASLPLSAVTALSSHDQRQLDREQVSQVRPHLPLLVRLGLVMGLGGSDLVGLYGLHSSKSMGVLAKRLKTEKEIESERLEQARVEKERLEQARIEKERLDKKRLKKERSKKRQSVSLSSESSLVKPKVNKPTATKPKESIAGATVMSYPSVTLTGSKKTKRPKKKGLKKTQTVPSCPVVPEKKTPSCPVAVPLPPVTFYTPLKNMQRTLRSLSRCGKAPLTLEHGVKASLITSQVPLCGGRHAVYLAETDMSPLIVKVGCSEETVRREKLFFERIRRKNVVMTQFREFRDHIIRDVMTGTIPAGLLPGVDTETRYTASELHHSDLRKWINEQAERLPSMTVMERAQLYHCNVTILTGIVKALVFLHSPEGKPVVHRDLHPANVLLDYPREGGVGELTSLLCDFETLKSDVGLTRHMTSLFVTEGYCAPERMQEVMDHQRRRGVERETATDPSMDLYSLGVLVHELFTGELPYRSPGKPYYKGASKECWKQYPLVAHFVTLCLRLDPSQRMPAIGLLHHPLLTSQRDRLQVLVDQCNHINQDSDGKKKRKRDFDESAVFTAKWIKSSPSGWMGRVERGDHYAPHVADQARDILGRSRLENMLPGMRSGITGPESLIRFIRNTKSHVICDLSGLCPWLFLDIAYGDYDDGKKPKKPISLLKDISNVSTKDIPSSIWK